LTLSSGTVYQLTGFQQSWSDDNSLHGATINTSGGTMYFNNAEGGSWTFGSAPPSDFRVAWFSPGVNPEIVATGPINYISRLTEAVIAPVPRGAAAQPSERRFVGFGGGVIRERRVAAP
jgi:hypothetical protein